MSGPQSDPDFRRVHRRPTRPMAQQQRPSRKYYQDVIITAPNRRVQHTYSHHVHHLDDVPSLLPKKTEDLSKPKTSKLVKFHPFKQSALVYIGIGLIVLGLSTSFLSLKQAHTSAAQVKRIAAVSQEASDPVVPSETKPTQSTVTYKVAPLLPAILKISKIGVDTRIRSLGTNKLDQLMAPSNIYDAGWYNSSAKPGDIGANGAILIDGHIHGPTQPGVFANLQKLVAGDIITIKRGDGNLFNYKVISQKNVDVDKFDIGDALSSAQPGIAGLNLVTCGGSYDKSGHYDQRTIVYSVLTN